MEAKGEPELEVGLARHSARGSSLCSGANHAPPRATRVHVFRNPNHPNQQDFQWAESGLNRRHLACKASALPLSYPPGRRGLIQARRNCQRALRAHRLFSRRTLRLSAARVARDNFPNSGVHVSTGPKP